MIACQSRLRRADQAICDEDDFAAGRGWSHSDVSAVVTEGAGDLDVAYGLHLGQGVDQSLILALLEGLYQGDPVSRRRKIVDVQGHADTCSHLGASAPGLGLDGFILVAGKPGWAASMTMPNTIRLLAMILNVFW